MTAWKIYHNPQCSKSREALALLQENGLNPEVIEYLKQPPSEEDLKCIIKKLQSPLSSLVRTKEEGYQKSKFDLNSEKEVVKHLLQNPKLMERPIVMKGDVAIIARPVETLHTYID